MNISIFGLGYVGCVGMGCLASQGHKIIGVDVSDKKVELINQGVPTIVEKDIDKLIMDGHKKGMVSATKDFVKAVHSSDISFICVGTPSSDNGHLDLTYIMKTAEQIGEALKEKTGFHVVVIRSTVFPGTNEKVGQLIADISGKEIDKDFAIVSQSIGRIQRPYEGKIVAKVYDFVDDVGMLMRFYTKRRTTYRKNNWKIDNIYLGG